MKFFTYHLTSPTGEKVDYMTPDKSATKLIAGHDIRVDWFEKQGWKVEKVANVVPAPQSAPQSTTQAPTLQSCPVCTQPMIFKEGISKTGKPWKGWFCPDKHEPIWLK